MNIENTSLHELPFKNLDKIPRLGIAIENTPLQYLERLSKRLEGPRIYIKRDDLTDLALGGSKARILQYVMADVLSHKANLVIASAYVQSNFCRQTAAAACKTGIKAVLVLKGKPGKTARGNLLLDVLLGAELHFIDTDDNDIVYSYIQELIESKKKKGFAPYFIDALGEASHFSSYAYLRCFKEIINQSQALNFHPKAIIFASASGGTQSGIEIGASFTEPNIKIIGVNPLSWSSEWIRSNTIRFIHRASKKLDLPIKKLTAEEIQVLSGYEGVANGIPTTQSLEAQTLFAQDEAIILDPTYTSKAAAAMIDMIRKGGFRRNESIVFIHTGGVPALFERSFPYKKNQVFTISIE